ncbi:MAG: hypothetical protein S0880_28385 [Actinomycetota bacterium]|nr:hypothetical protein [Actinomycetota bacterium]
MSATDTTAANDRDDVAGTTSAAGLPPVRDGLLGQWDQFIGPGAGVVENAGSIGLGVVGAAVAWHSPPRSHARWARGLLTALSFDLWGGAWANNTPACVRWYERPGQGPAEHLRFASIHVHPFAIAAIDGGGARRWVWAATQYAYLMATTAVLVRTAGRRRRMLALAATAGGITIDRVLGPSPSAPWFAPIFYAKLLAGHAGAGALGPWADLPGAYAAGDGIDR